MGRGSDRGGMDADPRSAEVFDEKSHIFSSKQLGPLAETIGIDRCIAYSPRNGGRSSKVKGLAISAIIGAVCIQTDMDFTQVDRFVDYLK